MSPSNNIQTVNDILQWSFGSTNTMVEKVFPEGFSADKTTLPSKLFNPENSFKNSYDLEYTGNQPFSEDNKVYYGYLTLEVARKEGGRMPLKEITHPRGRDYVSKIPLTLKKRKYSSSYSVK